MLGLLFHLKKDSTSIATLVFIIALILGYFVDLSRMNIMPLSMAAIFHHALPYADRYGSVEGKEGRQELQAHNNNFDFCLFHRIPDGIFPLTHLAQRI